MKKFVLLSLIAAMFSVNANADVYRESIDTCDEGEMRAALDRATRENRAVITIVECDNGIVRVTTQSLNVQPKMTVTTAPVAPVMPKCNNCGCMDCGVREQVVNREYFVRETVQQYKPVVQYVPSGTYTRVKPVCNQGC